jgi:glycerate kinase
MKIILAPDSFKGTFSSMEVIKHLEEAAMRHFSPLEVIKVPIADGGEGTVDSLVTATGGEYRVVEVMGPLSEMRVKAKYGIINGATAVIEMAQASGLPLIPAGKRDPLNTTTYGTGEIIKAALDDGIRDFIIGIGGSATNDGGIGAAQALGVKFLDKSGKEVGLGGKQLQCIEKIILHSLDPRIKESTITVICDVSNPLTGPNGATAVYGPQKGVNDRSFDILESGMKNYERLIMETTGMDMSVVPGSGAAGGLGAALVAFFGATLKPGIDTILDYVRFDDLLEGADIVVTGEGRIDGQSVYGKVPVGIAKRCKAKGVKVIAIVGGMGSEAQKVYDYGIYSIMPTVNAPMSLEEAIARAEELLRDAADRMFRLVKLGMTL